MLPHGSTQALTAILCFSGVFLLANSWYASAAIAPLPATTTRSEETTVNGDISARRAPAQLHDNQEQQQQQQTTLETCPNMVHYVFEGAEPRNETKAGVFEMFSYSDPSLNDGTLDLHACLVSCCEKAQHNDSCNVMFVYKHKCFHVRCVSNEACLPRDRPDVKDRLQMILVSPVRSQRESGTSATTSEEEAANTWMDAIAKAGMGGGIGSIGSFANAMLPPLSELNFWKQPHKYRYTPAQSRESAPNLAAYDELEDFPLAQKRMKQLLLSSGGGSVGGGGVGGSNGNALPDPEDLILAAASEGSAGGLGGIRTCELLLLQNTCPPKEECVTTSRSGSALGTCRCQRGYMRNMLMECVPIQDALDYSGMDEAGAQQQHSQMMADASEFLPIPAAASGLTTAQDREQNQNGDARGGSTVQESTEAEPQNKLIVTVDSQEVQLPEKEVTLSAVVVPDETTSSVKYKYLWTLISQPKGQMNGTISDQSESKVKLSNLSDGLYTFKVSVTGPNNAYGETMANVTVLPQKRINRMPQAIIAPPTLIIRQPTKNAILDGSSSTDDDRIVSWHWEVVISPIGYQPKLPEVNTLQLTDLTAPGNYTFKLTVTDSDNATNSTTANITVLKDTDYPPVANAGDAVILYLPNNNVTLNGTASTDDHEIVSWEWTKDSTDETKAVDMQNTRTPYVQLSNLEEGIYTFMLKVTDGSGQSSTAKVNVFVKPPSNTPPVAVAGKNSTVNLPQNWAILNGTLSTDDIRIVRYQWRQVSGPNNAVFINSTAPIANATTLTLGLYEFELSVSDENNNTATDSVWVQIIQERNAAPVANAGGDKTVTLPIPALYLNGSRSSDDLAVVKYVWEREESSLAAGHIVGNSDKEPILVLTNLVPGRYVFRLTVSDEQGLTSTDKATVLVHIDEQLMNLVQLTLPMGISVLTQAELDTIVQKLSLLLGDMKVHVRDLQYDPRTESVILVFYVETKDNNGGQLHSVGGLTVERLLKEKLQRDATILGTVFIDIRSVLCQNKCSGHGVCNAVTRACVCEAFWMPSVGYYWGIDEGNCDWSILYVIVCIIMLFLLLSGIFWTIACTRRRNRQPPIKKARSRPKIQKYSLIGAHDEEAPHSRRTTSISDTDTDSDVLFETRSKSNGSLRMNGASSSSRNGSNASSRQSQREAKGKYALTKMGRKVKT